jgi:N-acetylglucosaminyldiphosphoundecaprenol N-acetyl-beta-D-mannosaminyltransferase
MALDITRLDEVRVAGVSLTATDPREAAAWICAAAHSISTQAPRGLAVHLVNAYTISLIHTDSKYATSFSSSSVKLPDGNPLSRLGKLKNRKFRQVRGPRLFADVADIGRASELSHFLLGGDAETLTLLEAQLLTRYPGLNIVGSYSPPFRALTSMEMEEQDRRISASGAKVVWVGLGTPKQDYEVERLASHLPVVAIAIGAAFDFIAGTRKEAPHWISAVGLEWLFRLSTEPRRLWRRYLIGNLVFIWAVLRPRSER